MTFFRNNTCIKIAKFIAFLLVFSFVASFQLPVEAATKKQVKQTKKKNQKTVTQEMPQETVYELYVNRALGFVRVDRINSAKKTDTIKVMKCSVGRKGHATPKGTFKTSDYYDWRLMVDNTYAQYAVRFNNHIMFHSVPYLKRSPDSLEWDQYNMLGNPASLGCVRLTVADAKWIYDHCKKGTVVHVYDDVSEDMIVPDTRIISEKSPNKGWDPTDPNVENPWND